MYAHVCTPSCDAQAHLSMRDCAQLVHFKVASTSVRGSCKSCQGDWPGAKHSVQLPDQDYVVTQATITFCRHFSFVRGAKDQGKLSVAKRCIPLSSTIIPCSG